MIARLEGLAAKHDVLVLAAPSGYGKSVLLEQHLAMIAGRGLLIALPARADVADVVRAIVDALGVTWVQGVSSSLGDGSEPAGQWMTRRWLADRLAESGIDWLALDDVGRCLPDVHRFVSDLVAEITVIRWYLVVRELADISVAVVEAEGRCAVIERDALAFDLAETTAFAESLGVALDVGQGRELLKSTSGWPVAVALALQNPAAPLIDGIPASARDILGHYAEERALNDLSPDAREALSWAPYLPRLDAEVLAAVGIEHGAEALREIAQRLPLTRAVDRGCMVHDVLLERLADREEHRAAFDRERRWIVAGDAMSAAGDVAGALRAFERARAADRLAELLAAHGEVLIDRGYVADVSRALAFLHRQTIDVSALSLVEATVETLRGRMDRAEDILRRALAGPTLVAVVAAVRLSTLLVNRGRVGGAEILAPFAIAHPDDTDVQSAYAVALAALGRSDEAHSAAVRTAQLLGRAPDDHVAARAWQRLGLTHHFLGDRAVARDRCESALEIAERDGLVGEIARIRSLLYSIAIAEDDDEETVREAEGMAQAARRAAMPQVELAALTALLEDAAERGDDEAFAQYEDAFAGKGAVRGWGDVFPYALAKAMGEVARGHVVSARERMLRIIRDDQEPPEILAAATALAALLSIRLERNAVGRWLATLRDRLQAVESNPRGETAHTTTLTFTIAAFLEAAFGQEARAQRAARRARQAARTRRERALAQAAHAAMRSARPGGRGDAVDILERAGLRGYARLLDTASFTAAPRENVALSELECELLRAYCARRTAKDIASETGRNVNTVRAHVRNISRKLAANGRDDLIAIATARSLL